MENPEFYNDPVQVTGTMNDQGQVIAHELGRPEPAKAPDDQRK